MLTIRCASLVGLLSVLCLLPLGSPRLLADDSLKASRKDAQRDAQAAATMIDARVDKALARAGIKAAPKAEKSALIRRLSLDLTGRIPSYETARKPPSVKDFIEQCLSSESFNEHWSNVLTRSWVGRRRDPRANVFRDWLKNQLREQRAYDVIVRRVITTQSFDMRDPSTGAGYFFRRWGPDTSELAGQISRVFMGVQIQCAQCHDHPFSDWTQEQFHGFAAYFSVSGSHQVTLKNGQSRRFQPKSLWDNLKARKPSAPRLQRGADLVTQKNNAYFARMAVNRVWKEVFGRGLIDPIEDLEAQEGAFPMLLQFLAEDFMAHDFDIRHLLRGIVLSRTYQRSSRRPAKQADPAREYERLKQQTKPKEPEAHRRAKQRAAAQAQQELTLFARASLRPLTPEQIVDSLIRATGADKQDPKALKNKSRSQRRVARARYKYFKSQLREAFEQLYDDAENTQPDHFGGTIPQTLILLNGPFVNEAIQAEDETMLAEIVKRGGSTKKMVERVFLATLSRKPNKQEMGFARGHLKDKDGRSAALEDLMWALINSSEFLMNH